MSQLVQNSCKKRNAILGGIGVTLMLSLPMGCVSSDDGTEAEGVTAQDLSASFEATCPGGTIDAFGEDSSNRIYIAVAHADSCKRIDGTLDTFFFDVHWSGRCYNDLSNLNGVITCASG